MPSRTGKARGAAPPSGSAAPRAFSGRRGLRGSRGSRSSRGSAGRAGRAVQGEVGRYRVGAVVPGSVEAEGGVGAGGDRSVVGDVLDRHVRAGLGVAAVPQLGDRLAGGEGPGQGPAADRGAEVGDDDVGAEAAAPLAGDAVADLAGGSAGRSAGGRAGRAGGGGAGRAGGRAGGG